MTVCSVACALAFLLSAMIPLAEAQQTKVPDEPGYRDVSWFF